MEEKEKERDLGELESSKKRKRTTRETGPYVLRSLLEDLPLSSEGDRDDIEINCVEFLDQNLYVGTSASEILHFVQIPPDPEDPSGKPSYILASRLPPAFHNPPTPARPGVQQILLLPKINKACILCNWTVTFYSLPELSPVFGQTQIRPCNWIGGLDLNSTGDVGGKDGVSPTVTVLVSLNKRMRVIKIGEEPRAFKTIDFAGSMMSIRRDSFACVADSRSYALLDIDRQLKIPLFPISSLDNSQEGGGRVEDVSGNAGGGVSRSTSQASHYTPSDDRGHNRSTSLGAFISGRGPRPASMDRSGRDTPDRLFREASPAPAVGPQPIPPEPSPSSNKPLPPAPTEAEATATEQPPASSNPAPAPVLLQPHIVSPTPQEFLLVTGTGLSDPGVGMFVNLEGDPTRSTLEFDRYPDELVTDGRGVGVEPTPTNFDDAEEGYVLASMSRDFGEDQRHGIEIQRWDLDPGEGETIKYWLEIPKTVNVEDESQTSRIGLRYVLEAGDIFFDEVVDRLQLKRFSPFAARSMDASFISLKSIDSRTATSLERVSGERDLFEGGDTPLPEGWQERRDEEEHQIAQRLGHSKTHVVAWSGKNIWWTARNPLALRLDSSLSAFISTEIKEDKTYPSLDRRKTMEVINSLRGSEPKTEIEFLSLGYIRQRAGLLLFMSILDVLAEQPSEAEYRAAEEALLEGSLDPRVILAIVPILRNEIIEGKTGIWVHGGVKDSADGFITNSIPNNSDSNNKSMSDHILHFLRRFLAAWRKKKGFGSVANESEVFRSVDAALLIVLLQLDKSSPHGPPKGKSVRVDLYDLVDHGVDCFERAISLLESHHRLYVLSRLYQSRKMAGEVLATWRRIVEGERDEGGEFRDGEQKVREYLAKIRNSSLVQEYGVWLATRNPRLGVQVFAEDKGQVKFEPTQVVKILREGAPGAVKDYLEYLVFNKNHSEYINDLIAYYLDIVTSKLKESNEARATLAQTYESYRALRPPKPTYRQFITDNTVNEEWWHSRLRLLQLLGGSQGSAAQYDVTAILERIAPYVQELVPEVIILDGRQSRHQEALGLLTHGLGDYDTAINYCLLGGSSIYHPISGIIARESLPTQEQQGELFGFLLAEFLRIEDISNRVEQTSSLLERFGGWFDVGYVLSLIPDTWSVELVSGFLVSALRRIVRERSETMVAKALSGAENLKVNTDLIAKIDAAGPSVEA